MVAGAFFYWSNFTENLTADLSVTLEKFPYGPWLRTASGRHPC
jgi:hypothetical protein